MKYVLFGTVQLLFYKSTCQTLCINTIKSRPIWFSPFQLIHITSNLDSAMRYIFYPISLCVVCSFVSRASVWFYETLYRPLGNTESLDVSLNTSLRDNLDSLNNIFFFFSDIDFKLLLNLSKYTIIYILLHGVHRGVLKLCQNATSAAFLFYS